MDGWTGGAAQETPSTGSSSITSRWLKDDFRCNKMNRHFIILLRSYYYIMCLWSDPKTADWLMAKGTGPAPDQREDTLWISINGASSVIGWGEFIIIIIILQLHPNLITWHRTRWSCYYALAGPVDRDTVTREQIHYTATDKESIILHVLIDGALNKRKEALSHFWRLPVEKIIPLIVKLISIFPNSFRVSPVIDTWPNRIDL